MPAVGACNDNSAADRMRDTNKNYTYDDGTINWLPACADVDSIIVNETLFQEHNVAIPSDYDSFIAACEAFEELGIQGFCSDFGSDYTCMEVL